jgi:hypothetical protein
MASGDAKLLGQLTLGRKPIAWSHFTAMDHVAQVFSDPLGERHGCDDPAHFRTVPAESQRKRV